MSDTAYPDHVEVLHVLIEVEVATVRRSNVLRSIGKQDPHYSHTVDKTCSLCDSGSNVDGVNTNQKVDGFNAASGQGTRTPADVVSAAEHCPATIY